MARIKLVSWDLPTNNLLRILWNEWTEGDIIWKDADGNTISAADSMAGNADSAIVAIRSFREIKQKYIVPFETFCTHYPFLPVNVSFNFAYTLSIFCEDRQIVGGRGRYVGTSDSTYDVRCSIGIDNSVGISPIGQTVPNGETAWTLIQPLSDDMIEELNRRQSLGMSNRVSFYVQAFFAPTQITEIEICLDYAL